MKRLKRVVFPSSDIQQRVAELGAEITKHYRGKELHVVGVLNGAFVFLSDLIKQIPFPCYVHFIRAKSYNGKSQNQNIELSELPDLKGKDVLVVEDILDSGKTLERIMKNFSSIKPRSLKACVLLEKQRDRKHHPDIEWTGFEVEDIWLVGYGFDLEEYYRNLPYIAEVKN